MEKKDYIEQNNEIYVQEELPFIKSDSLSHLASVTVTRSNAFIMAKYKTSLLEKKLIMLAMTRIQQNERGELYATIYASELKDIMSLKTDNIYVQLKELSQSVIHHSMFVEDEENQKFISFNLCPAAQYENGAFTLYFSSHITPYVFQLTSNFSTMPILPFMNSRSGYTFRLYEIFLTKKYLLKGKKFIHWRVSLSELKLLLGCCDVGADEVQRSLKKGISYDEIVNNIAKEKVYDRWSDFSKRVLDCAQKELDKATDKELRFVYSPVRMGRGGKVKEVDFCIYWNDNYNPEYVTVKMDEMKGNRKLKDEALREKNARDAAVFFIKENIPEPFSKKEMTMLAKAANYDTDLIQRTYELAKQQYYIMNLTAWMKKALQERWADEAKIESYKGRTYEESASISEQYQEYRNASEDEKREAIAEYARKKNTYNQYTMQFDENEVQYKEEPESDSDVISISKEEYERLKREAGLI